MEPLESKLQQGKLFQTAIITHVFYFRFNQVPQNARLPQPLHPTEIHPSLICFPASGTERRVGGWARSPLPSEPSLPRLRHRGPQQDGSSGCQAPRSAALAQPHPAAHGGHREAGQALGSRGMAGVWGLGQPVGDGSLHGGMDGVGLGAPLPCPSRSAGSPFPTQGHSSRLLSGLAGAVLASRQGDRRCQEPLSRP